MKEIKVKLWKKNRYLCEISQQIGMYYAFLSPDNKQCHQWIKCRDFLHDALRNGEKEGEIFGFSYDPRENPSLDIEKMKMMVKRDPNKNEKNAEENTLNIMKSALSILQCVEKANGIEPLSELYCTSKDKNIYVFESAQDWMESTFMISLYTFIIRLGAKEIKFRGIKKLDSELKKLYEKSKSSRSRDNDIKYLGSVYPFFFKIIEKRKELRYINDKGEKFMSNKSVGLFHNNSGVVSLSDKADKNKNKGVNNNNLEELVDLASCLND